MNNHRGILWQALALVAFLGGCDSVSDIANGTGSKGGTGGKATGSGGKGAGGSSAQANSGVGGTMAAGGAKSTGQGGSGGSTPGSGGATSSPGGSGAGGSNTTGGTKAGGGSGTAGATGTGGTSAAGGSTGAAGSPGLDCTSCHGDQATNNPAPPADTAGKTDTASAGVGAHAKHLATSTWHRQGKCTDCHTLPTAIPHSNGKVDFTWSTPANASNAKPSFDTTALTCTGAYCHGTTLAGASSAKTAPVWNQVNDTWNACGTACHMTPPPASTGHPASTACETCHSKVIASFKAGTPATVVWKDASLHINGTVDVDTLTCTSCHGSGTNAAPPKDTQGNTATTAAGVGAHAQHLASSTWHRQGQCGDCHTTPTSTAHSNGKVDFTWGAPSNASGAAPSFSTSDVTCSGVYCHGTKMKDQAASIIHAPVWNKVDGSQDACGKSCHATPPGGTHTTSTTCENCHGDVISKFNGSSSTWKDATKHINGTVEKSEAACGSCHKIPPSDGFHNNRSHSVNATNCDRCHTSSTAATHNNGTVNVSCSKIPGYKAGGPCHGDD
jgi:predicted CxxxxCH...CXXCH cytochrome family protein